MHRHETSLGTGRKSLRQCDQGAIEQVGPPQGRLLVEGYATGHDGTAHDSLAKSECGRQRVLAAFGPSHYREMINTEMIEQRNQIALHPGQGGISRQPVSAANSRPIW
jgi:hypothetical protein